MFRRTGFDLVRLAAPLIVLSLAGCAVDGGSRDEAPGRVPPSISAAELGLPPALRPFHDELEPHGDWILVEPQGWVFRPRVNTVAWRPYQDGHWEPSWSYGWVWESNDPFGWITDHYGFWFYDDFQGWVWRPYGAWAPSWVAWVSVGEFVGWAPLPPPGATNYDEVPNGVFTYVNARTLGTPAGSRASFVSDIPDDPRGVHPIDRIASRNGIYWNAGPAPDAILGVGPAEQLRLDERDGRSGIAPPQRSITDNSIELGLPFLEARTTRAWSEARRELERMRARRQGRGNDTPAPAPEPTQTSSPVDDRPRIKPAPAPRDTAGASRDSLRLKFVPKPGAPRPPRRPPN